MILQKVFSCVEFYIQNFTEYLPKPEHFVLLWISTLSNTN